MKVLTPRLLLQLFTLILSIPLFLVASDYFTGTTVFRNIDSDRNILPYYSLAMMLLLPILGSIRIFKFKEYNNVLNYILICSGLVILFMFYDILINQQTL